MMNPSTSKSRQPPLVLFTIGHSTRSIEEFIELLQANGVNLLADVRKLPGSRRLPQFNQEERTKSLGVVGIEYRPFPGLGGRRPARKNAPPTEWDNSAWKNAAF